MVVTYRIAPVTHWFLSRAAGVKFACLVNILLGREAVPELLQYDCTADRLTPAVLRLFQNPTARQSQLDAFDEVLTHLSPGGKMPSFHAADMVLRLASQARSVSAV
jgi:lipid-A-disaccharide synthase